MTLQLKVGSKYIYKDRQYVPFVIVTKQLGFNLYGADTYHWGQSAPTGVVKTFSSDGQDNMGSSSLVAEYDSTYENADCILSEIVKWIRSYIEPSWADPVKITIGLEEAHHLSKLYTFQQNTNGLLFDLDILDYIIPVRLNALIGSTLTLETNTGCIYGVLPTYPIQVTPASTNSCAYTVDTQLNKIDGFRANMVCLNHEYVNVSFFDGAHAKWECKYCGKRRE